MKKVFPLISIIPLVFGLASCDFDNKNKENELESIIGYEDALSFKKALSISTLGGISLLEENKTSKNEDVLSDIAAFSNLLIKEEGSSVTTTKSDNDLYQKMTKIIVESFFEGKKELVLYYNEIIKEQDEDETEYNLEGIAIGFDKTYMLSGECELETDESELELKVVESKDNYIEISQEIENDELEFEYKMYQNGKKVFTQSIDMELEKNYTYLKFKETSNDTKVKLEIKVLDQIYVYYNKEVYLLENKENIYELKLTDLVYDQIFR